MRFSIVCSVAAYLISMAPFAAVARAGSTSSGGGEFITTETNPWFIGDEPVRYCVQSDPDGFSPTRQEINRAVHAVLTNWSETITAMHPIPTNGEILDGNPKNLTTAFVEETCRESTELRFLLGVHNQQTAAILKAYAHYTISFAEQTTFSHTTGRAHGIVWVAADQGRNVYNGPHIPGPFWSNETILYNVLLHEMGHVFGLGHSRTGVMFAGAPADAVMNASDSPYKWSIRGFPMQHWTRTGAAVCGIAGFDDWSYFMNLFQLKYPQEIDACLRTIDQNNLKLAFKAHGVVVGEFPLTITRRLSFAEAVNGIIGNYPPVAPSSDYPWWIAEQSFLPSRVDRVTASTKIGVNDAQILIETSDAGVHLVIGTPDPLSGIFIRESDIIFPKLEVGESTL